MSHIFDKWRMTFFSFTVRNLFTPSNICLSVEHISVYLSSVCTCTQLFFQSSLLLIFVFFLVVHCPWPTFPLSIFLYPSFSPPCHCLFFLSSVVSLISFISPLLLSSLSCLRGCWRSFRIWRPQFCLRRRESVTWRISFPSTLIALTDVHETHCLKNWSEFQNHYYYIINLHWQRTALLNTLPVLPLQSYHCVRIWMWTMYMQIDGPTNLNKLQSLLCC